MSCDILAERPPYTSSHLTSFTCAPRFHQTKMRTTLCLCMEGSSIMCCVPQGGESDLKLSVNSKCFTHKTIHRGQNNKHNGYLAETDRNGSKIHGVVLFYAAALTTVSPSALAQASATPAELGQYLTPQLSLGN